MGKLEGTLSPSATLVGDLGAQQTLVGELIMSASTLVGFMSAQVADPYYETSNESGTTIYVG